MEINWEPIIEYISYPRGIGFYSRKFNKIYISPVARNYPLFHRYLLEHEKEHYRIYNKYNNPIILLLLNLLLEWYTFFLWSINLKIFFESTRCLKDFSKIPFSEDAIYNFNALFLPEYLSLGWVNQKILEYLRPDDYGIVLLSLTFYLFIFRTDFIQYLILNLIGFFLMRFVKRIFHLS